MTLAYDYSHGIPKNTTDHNMVGELQISADKLKTISGQWLIEIEYSTIGINSNKQDRTNDSLAILKLNQSSDILQHSQNRPTGDRW